MIASVVVALVAFCFRQSNRTTKVETRIDGIDQRLDRIRVEIDALKMKEAKDLIDELKNTLNTLKPEDQPQAGSPIVPKDVSGLKKSKARTFRTKKRDAEIAPKTKKKSKAKLPSNIRSIPKPKRPQPLRSKKTNTGKPK
ncbi:MAG: hypothetical protein ISS79_00035 [Phycisphaerae bacterium]|nr:hypothetical protein [Phycisphaerae bacterium]